MVNKKPSEFALQFENLCAFIDFFEIKHSTAMQLCAEKIPGRSDPTDELGASFAPGFGDSDQKYLCLGWLVGWLVSFFVGFFRKPISPPKKIEINDQIHEMW